LAGETVKVLELLSHLEAEPSEAKPQTVPSLAAEILLREMPMACQAEPSHRITLFDELSAQALVWSPTETNTPLPGRFSQWEPVHRASCPILEVLALMSVPSPPTEIWSTQHPFACFSHLVPFNLLRVQEPSKPHMVVALTTATCFMPAGSFEVHWLLATSNFNTRGGFEVSAAHSVPSEAAERLLTKPAFFCQEEPVHFQGEPPVSSPQTSVALPTASCLNLTPCGVATLLQVPTEAD